MFDEKNDIPNILICVVHDDAFTAFSSQFSNLNNVQVVRSNIAQISANCIVTAANSFGRMDGGVDGTVNVMMTQFEKNMTYFHERVQRMIVDRFFGEQPVGTSMLVPTPHHPSVHFVAHTPTMRVPEDVGDSLNAYIAFRSTLIEILNHNKKHSDSSLKIRTIACTPFCTCSGGMTYARSASQMRKAYASLFEETIPIWDWNQLHTLHKKLKMDNI